MNKYNFPWTLCYQGQNPPAGAVVSKKSQKRPGTLDGKKLGSAEGPMGLGCALKVPQWGQ